MTTNINFIEVESDDGCFYCGRRKLSEHDKFYRVLVGDNTTEIVVCELCKGGFSRRLLEAVEKSYAAHFTFYIRRSFLELKNKLPSELFSELECSLEDYEIGNYNASFRVIGLVAEILTTKLYEHKFGKPTENYRLPWENKLGQLLDTARKTKNTCEEAVIYQLFSLKWFRNSVDHPSEYKITAEDVRLGLSSLAYLLQWSLRKN